MPSLSSLFSLGFELHSRWVLLMICSGIWYLVFGINTTSDISKLLYIVSLGSLFWEKKARKGKGRGRRGRVASPETSFGVRLSRRLQMFVYRPFRFSLSPFSALPKACSQTIISQAVRASAIWHNFEISLTSGIYSKYHIQIMLLFAYTTSGKGFVIFTCWYFKLSWNTTALSQSNCRNFSCSGITTVIGMSELLSPKSD